MLDILLNVLSPVFLVVGVVALAGRYIEVEGRAISSVVIYLMAPALILDGIANANLNPRELAQITAMATGVAMVMAAVGWGVARALRLKPNQTSAFILCLMMVNAANYGIPVNIFAFGAAAEEQALVYYALSATLVMALAIFVAAHGADGLGVAVRRVLTVPLTYAGALGLVLNLNDWALPLPLARAVGILADGAVPGMLVVLGLSLSRLRLESDLRLVLLASGLRLLLAPLVAVALAILLGLEGLTRTVTIVQSSMPTAVLASAIATEFGGDAAFTSAVILLSTLLSILSLSVLITLVV